LEELVDGKHGEVAVVVQNQTPHRGGACPDVGGLQSEFALEHGHVFPLIAACEFVDLCENASLHLFRRFIGEGDGENVSVERRFGHYVPDVFVCEVVGLAGAGRCAYYLDVAHCRSFYCQDKSSE
jgi:hypothetical protein